MRAPKMGCSPPPGVDGRAAQRAAFREWVLRGSGGALSAILEDYPPKRTEISHSTKARLQNRQLVRKARGGAGRSHEKLGRDRTVAAQAGYPRNSHNTAGRCGSRSNPRHKLLINALPPTCEDARR